MSETARRLLKAMADRDGLSMGAVVELAIRERAAQRQVTADAPVPEEAPAAA